MATPHADVPHSLCSAVVANELSVILDDSGKRRAMLRHNPNVRRALDAWFDCARQPPTAKGAKGKGKMTKDVKYEQYVAMYQASARAHRRTLLVTRAFFVAARGARAPDRRALSSASAPAVIFRLPIRRAPGDVARAHRSLRRDGRP
mgnify:CR=1 FL=1